jgi:3-hydroxyisobutyrate dehydrogenase-like beta-hydroxyacid dehydrogenase
MSEQVLGFVGVGRMGGPMANRLLDAGHTLCVFDTNADVVKPLAARGAKVASSAEEVASSSDMVLISLPTPPIVQAVSLGSILKGNRLKTLIDLSTTGPTVAGVVAKAASERGVAWVDSPVSGGIGGATKGTLAVMVSCRKDTFPVVDPVLKTFGKTFYVGEKPGLAQIAKLANNLLAAAAIVLSSEAVAMGVKGGARREDALRHHQRGQRAQQRDTGQISEIGDPAHVRLRVRDWPVVQGRPPLSRRSGSTGSTDGGGRSGSSDAGDYAGEVRC